MQNRPLKTANYVPFDNLGYIRPRKNIHLKQVVGFIERRFDYGKLSTSYMDLVANYGIGKRRAQRILKVGLQKRFLIAPENKKPQEYYPISRRFEVKEYLAKKNVPVDTTGTSPFKSPLSSAIEQQKASNFLEILLFSRYISRQIHKLQVEFTIDKKKLLDKDYYETISTKIWRQNKGKVLEDFIDGRKVIFTYYKNCNVAIWVACSEKPFNIETEDDISILYSFLGQVRDRLEYQLSDPRGRLVPPITSWTLKQSSVT